MQIIKDFLPQNQFLEIKNILTGGDNFPWYYGEGVAKKNVNDGYFFGHMFYMNNTQESKYFANVVMPIIGHMNFSYLIRAKANLYTKHELQDPHGFHVDFPEEHSVALYSVNTNNGYTLFKDDTRVESVENTLVIFDGNLEHASVPQTDQNIRVNININFR
jgi:hypothetical protein|tara:strand:+ start:7968 stop:8450 length:483 start_codon:yes stop_codon:yes gene_type:complete